MRDFMETDLGLGALNLMEDGTLLGLDGNEARRMLRQVRMHIRRQPDSGARAEFIARVHLLPEHIQKALREQRMHITEKRLYSVKTLTSGDKILKVFENQDTKTVGVRNVANAKLEKDHWFMLSGIQILTDPAGGANQYEATSALTRAFLDGEYSLKVGKKTHIDQDSLQVFGTARTDMPQNFLKLANPKLIEPEIELEMTIELATALGADTDFKVVFWGAITLPY